MKLVSSKSIIIISAYLFFLLVGIIYFPSTGRDDSHITYWAAHSLAEFGNLLNYNGEAVEQSSSLLHVIVLAILSSLLPMHIVTIGYVFSVVFALLTVYLMMKYMIRKDEKELSIFVFLPWLIYSLPSFMYWSFGGLESTLAALVFTLFIILLNEYIKFGGYKKLLHVGLIMFMALIVRPETIIVLFCFFISLLFIIFVQNKLFDINSIIKTRLINVGTIFSFTSILMLVSRYLYTGMLFPLPVIAKSGSHDLSRLKEGLIYFTDSILTTNSIVMFILALIMIIFSIFSEMFRGANNKFDFFILITSLFVIIYFAFIITSGGDWMEVGRFFVPILPMVAILALSILDRLKKRSVTIFIIMTMIITQSYAMFEIKKSTNFHLKDYKEISQYQLPASYSFFEKINRVHLRDIPLSENLKKTIETLKNHKENQPITFMSPYAGMVVFHTMKQYFGDVKFIDMYGLSTLDMYNCKLVSSTLNSNEGIKVTLKYFFKHAIDFKSECNIELPDIIFSSNLDHHLDGKPYSIIYSQEVSKDYMGSFDKNRLPLQSRMQIAIHNKYLKYFNKDTIWYW